MYQSQFKETTSRSVSSKRRSPLARLMGKLGRNISESGQTPLPLDEDNYGDDHRMGNQW